MEIILTEHYQPDILIGHLRLGEPVIAFTSILVSLFCFYAWYRLKMQFLQDEVRSFYLIFFALMGFSTLIGGIFGHLFIYRFPFYFKIPGWVLSMLAVSALQQGSISKIRYQIGPRLTQLFSRINYFSLGLMLLVVLATQWFPAVEIHSALGVLGMVLPIEIFRYRSGNHPDARLVFAGTGAMLAAAVVHITHFSLSRWFCFFDLAHLFMILGFWYFLKSMEAYLDVRYGRE